MLAVFLSTLGTTGAWAAQTNPVEKDLTQKKNDLTKIKKELSLTKEKEREIRGRESSVLGSLSAIENELYRRQKDLTEMERQLALNKRRLHRTESQIALLNRGMEKTKHEFTQRLVALFKMERVPPGTLLLASGSYLDLLRMDTYLRVILASDAGIVTAYRQQKDEKGRVQEGLVQEQRKRERAIVEVGKKRAEVKKVMAEQKALLKSIQTQRVVYRKVISELEGRAKDLQRLIDRLEQERKSLAHNKPAPTVLRPSLISPVQGKVISLFKEKGQNGIEIKAPMGTEIHAVGAGKVIYADWFKGFGHMVIVDHGGNLVTVSAYSSQLLKKAGDAVAQGEAIALVGSEGSLKGPCLYFEIRHRGKPQDPLEWIPRLNHVVSVPEGKDKEKKEL